MHTCGGRGGEEEGGDKKRRAEDAERDERIAEAEDFFL